MLVLEFMRPRVTVDKDHLWRFEIYVLSIRNQLNALTGGQFKRVSGVLVADRLNKNGVTIMKMQELEKQGMVAIDWTGLLAQAAAKWKDVLLVLIARAPEDDRLAQLAKDLGYTSP